MPLPAPLISSAINKKFWTLRIFLALFFLLGFGVIPANAKIYGSTWKIVRVIDAGTFEVIIPDLPVNANHAAVYLIVEKKLKLPRLLKGALESCGREYDAAVKAQQYVQEIVNKAKQIGFGNPKGLEELMRGETHEITADIMIDDKLLNDLLKEKNFIRYNWCI